MAVSAVWRLVYFLAPFPSEPKEQTAAHRRDALCASLRAQKQAAFGIRIVHDWNQASFLFLCAWFDLYFSAFRTHREVGLPSSGRL
jgi:hypothetical protein